MRAGLVRTGKFRPQDLNSRQLRPDFVLDSVADLPAYLAGL
jgi:ribonucleotide monophosphatase NagD (HAD superfamily)